MRPSTTLVRKISRSPAESTTVRLRSVPATSGVMTAGTVSPGPSSALVVLRSKGGCCAHHGGEVLRHAPSGTRRFGRKIEEVAKVADGQGPLTVTLVDPVRSAGSSDDPRGWSH